MDLYYIAILPNLTISEEITDFKLYAKENFNTKRALTSPPHITLIPPFQLEKDGLNLLYQTIKESIVTEKPFEVNIQNFNTFGDRVIYVDVICDDYLTQLWLRLKERMKANISIIDKYEGRPYIPHLTVAFKDLKKRIFPMAWEYFSQMEYKRIFFANQLALLKHNGQKWEVIEKFDFGKK